MRSLTCVVLLFIVFSLVAVGPAQQASPTVAPKLIDDSDPLPLPAGMMTEAVAESTPAKLLPCVADGAGSGIADRRPANPDADPYRVQGNCVVSGYWLTGSCVGGFPTCVERYDPQACPPNRLAIRKGFIECNFRNFVTVDLGRHCNPF
jgi:hypothetical protein